MRVGQIHNWLLRRVLVLAGILAVFTGVLIGKRYLHKVTTHLVQTLTGVMLLLIALLLGSGLI
jgi:putative Ca2+/H+ antiporter (TMEM165/GDT1 family)